MCHEMSSSLPYQSDPKFNQTVEPYTLKHGVFLGQVGPFNFLHSDFGNSSAYMFLAQNLP